MKNLSVHLTEYDKRNYQLIFSSNDWPFKFTLEFIFFTLKLQLLDDDLWQIDCFNCLITFVDARKRIWEKSARRHVSKTRKEEKGVEQQKLYTYI